MKPALYPARALLTIDRRAAALLCGSRRAPWAGPSETVKVLEPDQIGVMAERLRLRADACGHRRRLRRRYRGSLRTAIDR